jgi:septal ring factor EnvC (AmiA/AmiB activator)
MMRRREPRPLPLLRGLVLLCLLALHTPVFAQDAANQAELKRIIAAIDKAKSELGELRRQRGDLRQSLENAERRISALRDERHDMQDDLDWVETRLGLLNEEAAKFEAQRDEQQALIAAYLRQAARQGGQTNLTLLLRQENPRETARLLRYHAHLSAARAELIQGYAANLARLGGLRAEIDRERATLAARQKELDVQEQTLNGAQTEREAALVALDAELAAGDANLDQLEMQRVEIEVLLEELRLSVTDLPLGGSDEPITALKGKLPWPLEGKLEHTFGSARELGDLKWEGISISAPAGTEIHAVHPGRVVFADWFGSSGLLLILDHGDGYMSLYAHNQELYKAVGDWVGSGTLIGAAGNTGGQAGNGLYFEIRHDGRAENPANWLRSRD